MKIAALSLIIALPAVAGIARAEGPSTAPATAPTTAPAAPSGPVYSSDTAFVRFIYPASLIKTEAPTPNVTVSFKQSDPAGEIHLQVSANGKPLPDSAIEQVGDGLEDVIKRQQGTVVGRSDTTLGKAPAVRITWTLTSGSKNLKLCYVDAIHNGKIYTLAAASPADYYDKFQSLVQPIFDTFQFTDPPDKK